MHSLCRRLDCLKLVRICSIRLAFENYDKKKKNVAEPQTMCYCIIGYQLFIICYLLFRNKLSTKQEMFNEYYLREKLWL